MSGLGAVVMKYRRDMYFPTLLAVWTIIVCTLFALSEMLANGGY